MLCSCGSETQVLDTRFIDEIFRRKRACKKCGMVFFTKEVFLFKAEDNPNAHMNRAPKPKQIYTKAEAAEVKRKKVEIRRKNEDRKLKVPSYFIEEEDW